MKAIALFIVIAIAATTAFFLNQEKSPENVAAELQLLAKKRSVYRFIYVGDMGDTRCMRFTKYFGDGGGQSCFYLSDPDKLYFEYGRSVLSTLFLKPEPKNILIIGLGGGTLPTTLRKILPDVEIDVVEIDPAVTRMAEKYFFFKASEKTRVHEEDGRLFVKRAKQRKRQYDLVILDAFNGEYIPEHMLTIEYLQEVKAIIAEGGLMVANTFSRSRLYDSESVTYSKVFGEFINIRRDNRLIVWRNGGLPSDEAIKETAQRFTHTFKPFGAEIPDLLAHMKRDKDWDSDSPILTDQYSPSNLLNSM